MRKQLFSALCIVIFSSASYPILAQSCSAPTDQRVTNRTQSSVDVYWTPGSMSATSWSVEYGLWPLTQGTGTTTTSNNDTLSISGLSAGTPYAFYVREDCPGGGTSNWTGPYNFPTLCQDPVPVIPSWTPS